MICYLKSHWTCQEDFHSLCFFYYISLPLSQPMDEKSILNKIERKQRKYRFGHKNWAYRLVNFGQFGLVNFVARMLGVCCCCCFSLLEIVTHNYKSPPKYYIILFSTGRQNSIPFKMEYTIIGFDIVYFICIV